MKTDGIYTQYPELLRMLLVTLRIFYQMSTLSFITRTAILTVRLLKNSDGVPTVRHTPTLVGYQKKGGRRTVYMPLMSQTRESGTWLLMRDLWDGTEKIS